MGGVPLHALEPRLYSPPICPPPVKTSAAAPERSLDQRMEALKRANDIRTARAKLKKDLKAGRAEINALLLDPPEYVITAKVFDMSLAVPKYGRVKTNRILNQCRISPPRRLGGSPSASGRSWYPSCVASGPPRRSASGPYGESLCDTGPCGVGKGTLIASCSSASTALELSVSATTRLPRAGRGRWSRLPLPLRRRNSIDGSRQGISSSSRPTAATATAPCAQRSGGASIMATRSY